MAALIVIRVWKWYQSNRGRIRPWVLPSSALLIIAAIAGFSIRHWTWINQYLISQNIDSQGSQTGFFPAFFVTIGASLLGVIAIAFSLSIFAVQQASDRYTPAILRFYLRDRTSRVIFFTLGLFSFLLFVFALFPLNEFIAYEVSVALLVVIVSLILLRLLYRHSVRFVDPIYIISRIHDQAIRKLKRIGNSLDKAARRKPLQLKEGENILKLTNSQKVDFAKSALILAQPNLFLTIRHDLEQVYNLINRYMGRREYEVTNAGLRAISSITINYIDIRDGTFASDTFPGITGLDLSHDPFMADQDGVLAKLEDIGRVGSSRSDLVILREIVDSFFTIAVRASQIKYPLNDLHSYPHCMMAVGFLQMNLEDYLKRNELIDVGIHAIGRVSSIGLRLIQLGAYYDTATIISYLGKIALFGISSQKGRVLISHSFREYVRLIYSIVHSDKLPRDVLIKTILDESHRIIELYLRFNDEGGPVGMTAIEFSIGSLFDLTKTNSLPYIYDSLYDELRKSKGDQARSSIVIENLHELNEELRSFYHQVSKAAAERESFLIHYIDSNLSHIASILLDYYQSDFLNETQKEEILKDCILFLHVYGLLYHYHEKISASYQYHILEHILKTGYELNKMGLVQFLKEVLDIIISIAEAFLEKRTRNYEFESLRILHPAACLCILNGGQDLREHFFKGVKKGFWAKHKTKYPMKQESFFRELDEIDPLMMRLNYSITSFGDRLKSELKKEEIRSFVNEARKELT